jgi:hypothetical protein
MDAIRRRPLWMSRRIVLLMFAVAALALALTPMASPQAVDVGGSASGTGTWGDFFPTSTLTLAVTGTPQAATGTVTLTQGGQFMTGDARCIAIDETPTGFRARIAGEITAEVGFGMAGDGFRLAVYDNTPSGQMDQFGGLTVVSSGQPETTCDFVSAPRATLTAGDFIVTPVGVCPDNDDEDKDGLTNSRENLFSTLLRNSDSDRDGIPDGNDDSNRNGEDDEDEDDDDNGNQCPDEDSDDDGEDDEDEDDRDGDDDEENDDDDD